MLVESKPRWNPRFDGCPPVPLSPFPFQVEVSGSDDELLTVLAKFRHTLLGIPLPPPAPVDYEQALKDAQRESIQVSAGGRAGGKGSVRRPDPISKLGGREGGGKIGGGK